MAAAQALLASDLSSDLNNLVAAAVKGSATIYDKAMDANYLDPLLRPDLGGSYHRLFDGGHTIAGAVRAARDASPDDTIIEEALGTVQALLRDAATPRGLPLATWDKSTFDAVAGSLESTFAIPKSWFYDLNTYDAADLLGASVGVVAVALGWNRADTETFASLTASMGLPAAVGANPLLMVVMIVAAARAFHKARPGGEYTELVDGGFKGAVSSGATMAAVALATSAGGPAGVALLVGLTAGIVANSATKNVSDRSAASSPPEPATNPVTEEVTTTGRRSGGNGGSQPLIIPTAPRSRPGRGLVKTLAAPVGRPSIGASHRAGRRSITTA